MTDPKVREIPRSRPREDAAELQTLTGMLDFLRATAVNKVAGLTGEQAFARSVPASALTPASVVKHLAGVERFWFSIDFAAQDVAWPWTDDDPHGNFPIGQSDTVTAIVAGYVAECERSRQAIAGAAPDDRARGDGMSFTLRFALTHMIEETARHCGHLDLLRESIDGKTGE